MNKEYSPRPEGSMAIIRGHHVVREKMANRIRILEERIRELEAEVKQLREAKESSDGSYVPLR